MSNEQQYYENRELWSPERYEGADAERYAALANKVPLDVRTLLDVGCGNGLFLKHLGNRAGRDFERLFGTDRSAAALAWVRGGKAQASIDRLPFSNGTYDAVSCLEVLEHLPQMIYIRALDELSRVARRYILISVPFNEQLGQSLAECPMCRCRFHPFYHLRSFSPAAMEHLFDNRGFRCREVFYLHPVKLVPMEVETVLSLLGTVKRAVLSRPSGPMPGHTTCPACGYSPAADQNARPGVATQRRRPLGMTIRHLLTVKSSWRWIAGLYERA
jgi:SAM-dependent methyltransferase